MAISLNNHEDWFSKTYFCSVDCIKRRNINLHVKSYLGVFEKEENDYYVKEVTFEETPLKVFPRNLGKKFPNLMCLTIEDCEIKKITRRDLVGLENLEVLDLMNNKLTSLPDDLFTDMKKLKGIDFSGNRIERLSSKLLEPIASTLQWADLRYNMRIDEYFSSDSENPSALLKLKEAIDRKCLPPEVAPNCVEKENQCPQHKKMLNEFAIFRASGDFTDFTITFRGKEYRVHKCILASQSSVFKEMFTNNAVEAGDTSSRIKNCSENGFAMFLNYFYTGELTVDILKMTRAAIEMFELATAFGVLKLRALCISRIRNLLDDSNALEVFNLGHHNKSNDLKQSAFKVIQEMFPGMDGSFINKVGDVNNIFAAKRQAEERLQNGSRVLLQFVE